MGVKFTFCDTTWSYKAFWHFKITLASSIGINLTAMDGFGGDGNWDAVTDDLKLFLNHSDCDGGYTIEDCKKIIPRLRKIALSIPDKDEFKKSSLDIVTAMQEAISQGVPLEFE